MTTAALTPAHRSWRWRVFASTWACYAGFYFCRKPFSSAKSDLGHGLHFSELDLAHIYAVYLVTYALGQFLSGWLGPRVGPRRMLLGGMAMLVFLVLSAQYESFKLPLVILLIVTANILFFIDRRGER